jgi:hypothetical protein
MRRRNLNTTTIIVGTTIIILPGSRQNRLIIITQTAITGLSRGLAVAVAVAAQADVGGTRTRVEVKHSVVAVSLSNEISPEFQYPPCFEK